MRQYLLQTLGSIVLFGMMFASACNHPMVYGTEMQLGAFSKVFKGPAPTVYEATKRALMEEGYKIREDHPDTGILETGWVSAKAASHYVDLFDRRDYATVGAYYKLHLEISSEGEGQRVEIHSIAKSTISNLKSSGSEEDKIFSKVSDLLRSASIELTNVGMTEK